MTTTRAADRVVVGVDGTAAGLAAARWAAAEAARRDAALSVLQVQAPIASAMASVTLAACVDISDRASAAETVRRAVREVRAVAPGLPVTGEVVFGNIVAGLLAAGARSQLLVLGCHTILPRSLRRSWSYVAAVSSRAAVPVAVVEPVAAGSAVSPAVGGPVVVLSDEAAPAQRLIDYGCAQAERRGVGLDVVTVKKRPRRGTSPFGCECELFDALARCRERWPAVHAAGLVSFAKGDDEVRGRLNRAQLVVLEAQRGRSLLRRSGLTGPLGMRAGPRALTLVPV